MAPYVFLARTYETNPQNHFALQRNFWNQLLVIILEPIFKFVFWYFRRVSSEQTSPQSKSSSHFLNFFSNKSFRLFFPFIRYLLKKTRNYNQQFVWKNKTMPNNNSKPKPTLAHRNFQFVQIRHIHRQVKTAVDNQDTFFCIQKPKVIFNIFF